VNTVFRKQFYPFPNWLNWHGTLTLPLELFNPPLGSPDPHPEAHPGEWGGLWLESAVKGGPEPSILDDFCLGNVISKYLSKLRFGTR